LEADIEKINLEGESVLPEKEVLLTGNGIKKLEDELHNLKSVKRRDVAGRIRTAIEFGDITENSEYEDAKNEQAFIEGRIITLEKMLRHVRVIDTSQAPEDRSSTPSLDQRRPIQRPTRSPTNLRSAGRSSARRPVLWWRSRFPQAH
jgi:transcription elongation factor GreA